MHVLLNGSVENVEAKSVPYRDFYRVRKCDNHIHHTAAFTQQMFLHFLQRKAKESGDEVVMEDKKTKEDVTLTQLFDKLDIDPGHLSMDILGMRASHAFQRFDNFNASYNPSGKAELREVFLKYNNMIDGRFLTEMTRELFEKMEEDRYQYSELRRSVGGRSDKDWSKLAKWIVNNELICEHVRWMIQV